MIAIQEWTVTLLMACALSACGQGRAADTGGSNAPAPAATPKKDKPAAALITAADLPKGWTAIPNADGKGRAGSCLDKLAAPGGPFDRNIAPTATFARGKIGPFLAASVVGQPADVVLPKVNTILAACNGSSSGDGLTTSIEPLSLSGLPQGSLAVRGADAGKGGHIRYTIVAAGTGAATSFVFAVTPLGEVDNTVVVSAINAMHKRLPQP